MINISILVITSLTILIVIYLIYSKYNSKWPFNKDKGKDNKDNNDNKGIKLWTNFDVITDYWTFLILQPSSSNISIGFSPPSSDGTFDIFAENNAVRNYRLNCIRNYNNTDGVFAITNIIIGSNPVIGNIQNFNVYTYNKTNKKINQFTISRPVDVIQKSPKPLYSVGVINIRGDDLSNIQQIQGDFRNNIPSKIIFN